MGQGKTQERLGQLIDDAAQRDAVHIAVAPVMAGQRLGPGDHVGLMVDGRAGLMPSPIGVVDPSLTTRVMEGEWFWLFLYPNTITSLRHDWTYPAFPVTAPRALSKAASRTYLEGIAKSTGVSYDELMAEARRNFCGDSLCFGHDFDYGASNELLSTFWHHVGIVIDAVPLPDAPTPYFSCTC